VNLCLGAAPCAADERRAEGSQRADFSKLAQETEPHTVAINEQPAAVPQALTSMMLELPGIRRYENALFKA
jgi:hypothetical protein